MKRLHECAVAKEGNKRVGYFLCEGLPGVQTNDWKYVTIEKFNQLVKNKEVQYFVWNNGRAEVKYDAEEIAYMRNMPMGDELIKETEMYYHDLDVNFRQSDINRAFSDSQYLAVAIAASTRAVVGDFITMFIMGQHLEDVAKWVQPPFGLVVQTAPQVVSVTMPYNAFKSGVKKFNRKLLICTSLPRFMVNHRSKVPFTALSASSNEIITELVNLCDNLTKSNLA